MSNKAPKKNRKRRSFTFENMERREMMTANMGIALEPVEAPVAVVASPAINELSILNSNFNNSMGSATQIGTVASSASRFGSVGGSDPVDYWRFRVANSGQTTIQLTGLSRDVDIQILDASGRVLASGVRGGNSSESVTLNLQSGRDYFVKVYPYGSGPVSNYLLSINGPSTPSTPSNNTPGGAINLGTVSTAVNARGSVGGADPVDFWKFRVARSGQTTIQLSGMSRDVDIQIMDSSGRVLATGARGGTSAESVTVNLQAGQEYFVRVYPYGNGPVSNYQLSVNAPSIPSTPSDDTPSGAINLGTVSTAVNARGSVGGADPVDFWKFRVARSGQTTIQLSGMSRDVDIQIMDSSGRVLATGARGGTSAESVTVNLQAGQEYFVRVYPYGNGPMSNYDLRVTAPVVLNNDTMAGATPLGSVYNTPRWVSGRIQPGNPADWYSFTPSAGAGNFARISLVSMTQDLDVQVYDSNGNLVASSARGGSSNEFLQIAVTSGRQYFIRVFPYGGAVSNYSLAVSHSPFMPMVY